MADYPHARPRQPGSTWPWPHANVDGTVLHLNEQMRVRSLVDAEVENRGRTIKVAAGDIAYVMCGTRGQLNLIKHGRGNTNYYDVKTNVKLGRDFEMLPDSVPTLLNEQARATNEERQAALNRLRDGSAGLGLFDIF